MYILKQVNYIIIYSKGFMFSFLFPHAYEFLLLLKPAPDFEEVSLFSSEP